MYNNNCYIQLFNVKKMKVKVKTILFNIFLIIISNTIVVYSTNIKYSTWQFILNVVILIIFEILIKVKKCFLMLEICLIEVFAVQCYPIYILH